MLRTKCNFTIDSCKQFKQKLFTWITQFETVVWLDSNNYDQAYSSFDCALAVNEFTCIKTDYKNAFDALKEYQSNTKDYIFGYISYDAKNDIENLNSANFDGLHFVDLYFFQPQKLIFIKGNIVEFQYLKINENEIQKDFELICQQSHIPFFDKRTKNNDVNIQLRIQKDEYHKKVAKILEHIGKGDIYEINFCQEFYAENTTINPYKVYEHLNEISKPPFATFLKKGHQYLLSATPERFVKKENNKLISQPIKGTAKRSSNKMDDDIIAFDLACDQKERSENIMIVDLVRNDLSKLAKKGSVKVEELCKVYSFKQVHQLISTVVSKVNKKTHPVDIIKSLFPMGSMTGTPKISAMKIIEKIEETKRGLYSGTVGYFTPSGNFDFNVIIRSILYNEQKKYVSYSVGGAIISKSTPEKEYEECLLKAKALEFVLSN